MNRREFLLRGSGGALAAGTMSIWPMCSRGQQQAQAEVRIGVVGVGNRGTYLLRTLLRVPGVKVTSVCDLDSKRVTEAAAICQQAQGKSPAVFSTDPDAYERMLQRNDIDAVLIATPTEWHCPMAIAAMKAGKHVGSEVPAGFGRDELWDLVRTKETTGRRYMLLENYAYMRENMAIWNMVRKGVFGEAYYAECAYIHDCRFMLFKEDGSLDWWGEWASKYYGHDYPTHGLGPVSKWLGLNDGDRMTHCSAMMTKPRVLREYTRNRFGADSDQAKIEWSNGDFTSVMIKTAKGKVIRSDYDVNSPRPMSNYYLLQGTKGLYDSRTGVYFEGTPELWEKPGPYWRKYDHECWRHFGEEVAQTGHGGGDYFVLRDFVEMARRDCEPWIDVYDAASWSVIYHCSRESIDKSGGAMGIPDFTGGRWETDDWRDTAPASV